MTSTGPHNRGTDILLRTSLGGIATEKKHRSPLPGASIVLGTLSVVTFWIVGLGFTLGVAATICGTIATSRPTVADDEAASLRALLGIVAGAGGIIVSAAALLLPMLIYS